MRRSTAGKIAFDLHNRRVTKSQQQGDHFITCKAMGTRCTEEFMTKVHAPRRQPAGERTYRWSGTEQFDLCGMREINFSKDAPGGKIAAIIECPRIGR